MRPEKDPVGPTSTPLQCPDGIHNPLPNVTVPGDTKIPTTRPPIGRAIETDADIASLESLRETTGTPKAGRLYKGPKREPNPSLAFFKIFFIFPAMAEYVRPSNALISLSQPRDTHPFSDDDDEESRRRARSTAAPAGGGGELSSGSAGRKPRGRPPGSKNKPKPPVVITRESEAAMHPMVLELAPGNDILDCVAVFARRRRLGISVISGSGIVANVPLRHPTANPPVMTLHGRYDILSLSGTILPPPSATSGAPQATFSISLAGTQGHVIGGTLAGPLMAAGPIVLVAASFTNPEFHRLPVAVAAAEDERAAAAGAVKEEEMKPGGVEASVPVYGVPSGPRPLAGPFPHHDMVL